MKQRHVEQVGRHSSTRPSGHAMYPGNHTVVLPREVVGVVVWYAHRVSPARLQNLIEESECESFAITSANTWKIEHGFYTQNTHIHEALLYDPPRTLITEPRAAFTYKMQHIAEPYSPNICGALQNLIGKSECESFAATHASTRSSEWKIEHGFDMQNANMHSVLCRNQT